MHNTTLCNGGGGKSYFLVFVKCVITFAFICWYLLVFVCICMYSPTFVFTHNSPCYQKHPHNPCTTHCTTPVFNTNHSKNDLIKAKESELLQSAEKLMELASFSWFWKWAVSDLAFFSSLCLFTFVCRLFLGV